MAGEQDKVSSRRLWVGAVLVATAALTAACFLLVATAAWWTSRRPEAVIPHKTSAETHVVAPRMSEDALQTYFPPIYEATRPETVRVLVEHGVDVNERGPNGRTGLEEAASKYAEYRCRPDGGEHARQFRELTEAYLEHGAEYDIRSACYLGDASRVKTLIEEDARQALDHIAMHAAARYGNSQIVSTLVTSGAVPDDAVHEGLPASYYALPYPDTLQVLLDAGADPNTVLHYRPVGVRTGIPYPYMSPDGSTLLHQAAFGNHAVSVSRLLKLGADVNASDENGFTPLHCSAVYNAVDVAKLLLESGADPNAKDYAGRTPLSHATSDVASVLREYGVNNGEPK